MRLEKAAPLTDDAFDDLMTRFAPFEARPAIAVAVSGGGDSMALAALAKTWADRRGGSACAVIVDHGLRPEAAEEAATVADRCQALDLKSTILVWTGDKPDRGIQAAARHARYRLLTEACRNAGILHLLVAHHADDQAETVALRVERDSMLTGLAGMSALLEWRDLRLLRPLLPVSKARLLATATARGLRWIEDPSNLNVAFARGRLRRSRAALPDAGVVADRQRQRQANETQTAADLAAAVAIMPVGNALLDLGVWRKFDDRRRQEVVAHTAMTVGGLAFAPRRAALLSFCERLDDDGAFSRTTLGRCLWRRKGGKLLICRENRGLPESRPLGPGVTERWDGRYVVSTLASGVSVGPLGADGYRQLADTRVIQGVPREIAVVLPAFSDLEGLAAVPYLHWTRGGVGSGRDKATFAPQHPLAPAGFLPSAA
ncbi:MAG: tRNA lysidine(34) synthetase TilS [Pseudomonadota bacterium]